MSSDFWTTSFSQTWTFHFYLSDVSSLHQTTRWKRLHVRIQLTLIDDSWSRCLYQTVEYIGHCFPGCNPAGHLVPEGLLWTMWLSIKRLTAGCHSYFFSWFNFLWRWKLYILKFRFKHSAEQRLQNKSNKNKPEKRQRWRPPQIRTEVGVRTGEGVTADLWPQHENTQHKQTAGFYVQQCRQKKHSVGKKVKRNLDFYHNFTALEAKKKQHKKYILCM